MSDWNQRYLDGDTPWDQDEPSAELVRLLDERALAPGRVLEIGCGTGANAVELARRGFTVSAFDVSEQAVARARARLARTGLSADLRVASVHDVGDIGDVAGERAPFPLVFDRGVYHVLRREPDDLAALLTLLRRVTAPCSLWLSLSGNANEPGEGPPRVSTLEMATELGPLFELVELREVRLRATFADGTEFAPLAWSALWRRRGAGADVRVHEATA